jgi:hypothetical protein
MIVIVKLDVILGTPTPLCSTYMHDASSAYDVKPCSLFDLVGQGVGAALTSVRVRCPVTEASASRLQHSL